MTNPLIAPTATEMTVYLAEMRFFVGARFARECRRRFLSPFRRVLRRCRQSTLAAVSEASPLLVGPVPCQYPSVLSDAKNARAMLAAGVTPLFNRHQQAESTIRKVVSIDPRYSSQEYVCISCGFSTHADVNAALVIKRRAQLALTSEPYPAEDAGRRATMRCVGTHNESGRLTTEMVELGRCGRA
jgi:hypothetical protein